MLNSFFASFSLVVLDPVVFFQLICAPDISNEAGLRVGARTPKSIINLLCFIYIFRVFFPGKINLVTLIGDFAGKC